MVDRSAILSLSFRVAVALVAMVGLVLLFVPGVARGLGRPSDAAPWTLTRPPDTSDAVRRNLLESDGLQVSGRQWSANRAEWSSLDESERKQLVQRFDQLQNLSAPERKSLVARYKALSQKSDLQRQQLRRQAAALEKFEASLSRQDVAALESLTGKNRAVHLVKLWRASRGLD